MKYTVRYLVTGSVSVEIEADSLKEAIEKSYKMRVDTSDLDCECIETDEIYNEDDEIVWVQHEEF